MKNTRDHSNKETKSFGLLPVILATVMALILGFAVPELWAGRKGHDNDDDGDEQPFKDAEFFIEYNSTAGDTGVQVFLDDDNWKKITISNPKDRTLFKVKGSGTLGRQGLTELFFESVEPELAALPMVKFLKRFPEGDYEFEGIRNDGIELESEVEFTHVIPCGPEVLPVDGTVVDSGLDVVISWYEVETVVDPAATDNAEETMCTDPIKLGQNLEIDTYQVIVENDEVDLIINLTSDARELTVPPELIEEDTLYIFEVLAKEESGNQTITEGYFCTGPGLTEEECDGLFEAL